MKSKTKLYISPADVRKAFSAAGFHTVSDIAPLTAGEFNSAYCVTADAAQYVLKVAPQKDSAHTLTYETDLMRQEVFFYQQIRAKTDVRVPQIFYSDFSCSLLPSAFFIMEKLQGQPLTACRLSGAERTAMHEQIGELLAKLHTIRGEQYGYAQNGLYPNWYLAVRSMTENVLADCEKIGKRCKAGEQVLLLIEQNRALLETVPCVYTHFDVWEGNLFYDPSNRAAGLTLIDPERSFWGDGIGDFCSLELLKPLQDKRSLLAGYNRLAEQPILPTEEEKLRYAVLLGYLGLIVYTERFYRYRKTQIKYRANSILAKTLLQMALQSLH